MLRIILAILINAFISLSVAVYSLDNLVGYWDSQTMSESYNISVHVDNPDSFFWLLPYDIGSLYNFQVSSGYRGFDRLVPINGIIELGNVNHYGLVLVEKSGEIRKFYSFSYDRNLGRHILLERKSPGFNVLQYFLYHTMKSFGLLMSLFLLLAGVDVLCFRSTRKFLYPSIILSGILSFVTVYGFIYTPLFTL